jgi:hypothetical protein
MNIIYITYNLLTFKCNNTFTIAASPATYEVQQNTILNYSLKTQWYI